MIELVPFEPGLTAGVAQCYNDLMVDVPYSRPIPVERFGDDPVTLLGRRPLRNQEIAAARADDGEVVGYVHVGIALPPEQPWHTQGEPGVIRVLAYRPGQRAVGQALLEWAEAWARRHERTAMEAFSLAFRYPFGLAPYAHLPDSIAHVWALFTMNGYREAGSELHLHWCDFLPPTPVRPDLEFELSHEWQDGPFGRQVEVVARQGETYLGRCIMIRMQEDPEWGFCDELDVAEAFQGKRLGMFLLTTGLQEMRGLGCVHAGISTNWTNYRAALFYTNLGYRFTCRTASFWKGLAP